MIQETPEELFEKELLRRGLGEKTIEKYMRELKKIPKDQTVTEKMLYEFLDTRPGNVARAFTKIFAEYNKLRDFKLPRRTGRKAQRLVNIMSEEEYEKLRLALYTRSVKYGIMLDLSYWCGLRREEVCNIAIDWFVLDEWSEGKPCRLKIIGKGNKQRLVIVPAWLMPTILKYMEFRAENDAISEKERLFGIGVRWWWEVFTEVSFKVLGKHYKPHEMRHTRTVLWRRAGVPIDKVSKRLGHTSIATTQRYWNLDPDEVAKDWETEVK